MTIRLLPEHPSRVPGAGALGRHVHHDPRSWSYRLPTADLQVVDVRHHRHIDVLDQGALGSCTGNAMVGALGTSPVWEPLPIGTILDQETAIQIYSAATSIDDWPGQWPPTDTGSSGLAVAKVTRSRGLISGYVHTFTVEDALRAASVGPLLLGTHWYSSFDEPDQASGLIGIDRDAFVRGGHEVVIDEVLVEEELVGITNSWGPWWGAHGRCYLSWEDLDRLLAEDGDVIVPVPLSQPAPVPDPTVPDPAADPVGWLRAVWAQLLAWLRRHIGG